MRNLTHKLEMLPMWVLFHASIVFGAASAGLATARMLPVSTMPRLTKRLEGQEHTLLQLNATVVVPRAQAQNLCPNQNAAPQTSATFSPLRFVHIPRAGGTTIEDCARDEASRRLRWGKFMPGMESLREEKILDHGHCVPWHLPPNLVEASYGDAETFCVVRHPFTRMLSQYGFVCGYYPNGEDHDCSAQGLNRWLESALDAHTAYPYREDCHLLPAAAFVYGWDLQSRQPLASSGKKFCKHVLRFEHLVSQFNSLMETSGYPYRLPVSRAAGSDPNTRSPLGCHALRPEDMTVENRQRLEQMYAQDFDVFGYTNESSSWAVEESMSFLQWE